MHIDHLRLRGIAADMLAAAGSADPEAQAVADHLVEANLAGHDSHGVGLLPTYLHHVRQGTLVPNQTEEVVSEAGSLAVWDGRQGYGQVIAARAMDWAIETARTHGVAVHGLRNTHHIGRVGSYGEQVVGAGLVSLHFVNILSERPILAPYGAHEPRFGTNPICIAIPGTGRTPPIVLDMATSRIALGKIRVAHNEGAPVPEGALVDGHGQPTTDPAALYADPRGALLPFGEYKGSGLALACDLLAGAIVGAGSRPPDGSGLHARILNGMLTIVVDPERLTSRGFIEQEIDSFVAYVKTAAANDPAHPVRIAGDPERDARADRTAQGIPIDPKSWAEIRAAASEVGVTLEPSPIQG